MKREEEEKLPGESVPGQDTIERKEKMEFRFGRSTQSEMKLEPNWTKLTVLSRNFNNFIKDRNEIIEKGKGCYVFSEKNGKYVSFENVQSLEEAFKVLELEEYPRSSLAIMLESSHERTVQFTNGVDYKPFLRSVIWESPTFGLHGAMDNMLFDTGASDIILFDYKNAGFLSGDMFYGLSLTTNASLGKNPVIKANITRMGLPEKPFKPIPVVSMNLHAEYLYHLIKESIPIKVEDDYYLTHLSQFIGSSEVQEWISKERYFPPDGNLKETMEHLRIATNVNGFDFNGLLGRTFICQYDFSFDSLAQKLEMK